MTVNATYITEKNYIRKKRFVLLVEAHLTT